MAISPSAFRSSRYWPMIRKASSIRARSSSLPPSMAGLSLCLGDHLSSLQGSLRSSQLIAIVEAGSGISRRAMTQTSNRFFDEMARLMNDAAGVAQGVKREIDTLFRTRAESMLRDLDVVQREEFEAVKDMARLAREENEALKARIAALEAKLGSGQSPSS